MIPASRQFQAPGLLLGRAGSRETQVLFSESTTTTTIFFSFLQHIFLPCSFSFDSFGSSSICKTDLDTETYPQTVVPRLRRLLVPGLSKGRLLLHFLAIVVVFIPARLCVTLGL